jgi:succinylglutamate desuccinylase
VPRVLGRIAGGGPGPLLVVVAGIHGNEPAGALAVRRLWPALRRLAPRLRGDVVACAGNRAALERDVRYLDRDLNRGWGADRPPAPAADREDLEQQELHATLAGVLDAARGPVFFLDLHTTSAAGIPFAMVYRDRPAPDFAVHFPLPIVAGLLDLVDGTLLDWMRRRGATVLGIEAGQNADPGAVDRHESVLWIALAAAGVLRDDEVPRLAAHRARLDACRGDLPHVLEVEERHVIEPADGFHMRPGFANIQRVQAGELLAHDRRGEIRAPRAGVLLLPLYQAQGDDGFFLGRELEPRPAAAGAC